MKHSISIALAAASMFAATSADAQVIYKNKDYQIKGNQVTQGKFKATANSATDITSNYEEKEWDSPAPNYMPDMDPKIDRQHWVLKKDISHLPQYTSTLKLDNALYNMSLEESELAIEPDSTYRTGVYWGGVWTRDVSYSILHSLAQLCPEVSMKSLRAKVNVNNRIIQDTGTGGAWPCSTDRVTWVLAAWECYLVTGSKEWLDFIYPVIRNTVEDDRVVAYDPETQLMRGETSWLDWREQEYPLWAEPKDIYRSEPMGTTAVHYRSIQILSEICKLEGQMAQAKKYAGWAEEIKAGMNKNLWNEQMGLYSIYLYGRNHMVQHPQMEILGESFAILWDIASADRQKLISQKMVSEPFGTPDFYPNLKDQYPYHNDAMWPFTQAYWMKAQAKAGNEEGVLHGIASIYRLAALALTNLENMVIYNGKEKGLPINSPRQLWSVAAQAAIVPNIYFGIQYDVDGIRFTPMVPKSLSAKRQLKNFKYRDAVLDMSIEGFGNEIKSFKLDGVEAEPRFAASLKGNHTVEIVLANKQPAKLAMTMQGNQYQPLTPNAKVEGKVLSWEPVETATAYKVLRDGKVVKELAADVLKYDLSAQGEYAVVAMNQDGWQSYMSEPVNYYNNVQTFEVEQFGLPFNPDRKAVKESAGAGGGLAGKTEERVVVPTLKGVDISGVCGNAAMITRNENILISIPVEVAEDGRYAIDWRYANGNGPVNTDNKCATRVLKVDGNTAGVSVFPHRDRWNNWGWSNVVNVNLTKGRHMITLEFCDTVENMNVHVNQALLDQMRVTKL